MTVMWSTYQCVTTTDRCPWLVSTHFYGILCLHANLSGVCIGCLVNQHTLLATYINMYMLDSVLTSNVSVAILQSLWVHKYNRQDVLVILQSLWVYKYNRQDVLVILQSLWVYKYKKHAIHAIHLSMVKLSVHI